LERSESLAAIAADPVPATVRAAREREAAKPNAPVIVVAAVAAAIRRWPEDRRKLRMKNPPQEKSG
jgi:hypothetical protein